MRVFIYTAAMIMAEGLFPQGLVDSLALKYAGLISRAELERDLAFLASDAMEGRDTGERGQKMAAAYIRQHFVNAGIPPVPTQQGIEDGYYQPFELEVQQLGNIGIRTNERELRFMSDILYFDQSIQQGETPLNELIHLGDGSTLNAVTNLDNKNIWLVKDNMPVTELMAWVRRHSGVLKASGAATVIISTNQFLPLKEAIGHYLQGKRMTLAEMNAEKGPDTQVIVVDDTAMTHILGSPRKLVSAKKKKPGKRHPTNAVLVRVPGKGKVHTENVLAYIEGEEKKDELVIVTAHYDHVGVENGEVYNGADDNGSGTVAVMAIAKAFAKAKADGNGPRRSVLIMPVSAEEKGLLGSRYYTENPVFPLENTVANLNIDMIGRIDSAHLNSGPYVYVIGSDRLSSELHEINEAANSHVGLALDYTFNAEDDPNRFYYRSDHYNFARKGIPAMFYFSGVHADYHQPGDMVDKIRYDLLHKRALLVFHTAWELANRPERIVVDKPLGE